MSCGGHFSKEAIMMTGRERFLRTMGYRPCDRPPLWDEGIREDVLDAWGRQGGAAPESLLDEYRYDGRRMVDVNLNPVPKFEAGERDNAFSELRRRYRPCASERFPQDWEERVRAWSNREEPLGMVVSRGVFLSQGVGDWRSLERLLFAMADAPSEVESVQEAATALSLWALERVCAEVTLDFAVFSEPIASFHAPVISPAYYRRFAMPYYRRAVDRLRAADVNVVVLQAFGNVNPFIPLFLEVGMNALWCSHTRPAGMDYAAIRRRYGKDLRLIGGIDAVALAKGRPAIDRALENTVAPLLESGGYLPLLDDRVRPDVPYEAYRYYRTQLEKRVLGD